VGGAAVADAEAALEQRRAGLAEFEDQAHGVVEHGIVLVGVGLEPSPSISRSLGDFEEAFDVFGLACAFQKATTAAVSFR
jgi:hypothetical protein